MKPSVLPLALGSLALCAAFTACGADERTLVFDYNPLGAAGESANGGDASGGDASSAGAIDIANGGKSSDAGAAGAESAESGASNGGAGGSGGAPIAGGANGGSADGGNTSSGNGGTAGLADAGTTFAGAAGKPFEGPCGDLNHDAVDDCSQTLVQNSRFDTVASDWVSESSLTQTWDARNASGKAGSGSLLLSNTTPVVPGALGSAMVGSHQCVPVTSEAYYDVAARILLADGQTGGQGGINLALFDDASCAGNVVSGVTPIIGGEAGQWHDLYGKVWIPGGVHSVYVRLVAIKPFTQPALSVLIDDVLIVKH